MRFPAVGKLLSLPFLALPCLLYLTLPYLTLPCSTLPYFILPMPYLTLPYPTLSYRTLPFRTVPYVVPCPTTSHDGSPCASSHAPGGVPTFRGRCCSRISDFRERCSGAAPPHGLYKGRQARDKKEAGVAASLRYPLRYPLGVKRQL